MGRLTKDPEYSNAGSKGTPRAVFTIAVDRRYAAQGQERLADFPQCVAWNKTAEFAQKYLKKGAKIVVEGEIRTRSYDAQDGSKRYVTEVEAQNIEFCESKKTGGSGEFTPVDEGELPF